MKFTPRLPGENVNVSRTHPLAELAWMLGGLALILSLFYLLIGLAVEIVAERLPAGAERWLGRQALQNFAAAESPLLQNRLQALLASLPVDSPLRSHGEDFQARVVDTDEINALALPGGCIVVFRGLLEAVESENELDMVLAHELGHFAHHDQLKGLGRGLVATLLSMALFGSDSSATGLVASLTLSFDARYSQRQEAAADAWGLDLLVARYSHAGGAVDFFARMSRREDAPKIAYLRASHPHPADRIRNLEQHIAERNYRMLPVVPINGKSLFLSSPRS